MYTFKEVGEVKEMDEEARVEWKIFDFFSVAKDVHQYSPAITFGGVSWHLLLFPEVTSDSDDLCLILWPELCRDYAAEYSFGLKKLDGNVEQLDLEKMDCTMEIFPKIVHFAKKLNTMEAFALPRTYSTIKLSKIQQRKSELVPSDTLTVVCTITRETTRPSVLDKADLIRMDTLCGDFRNLFANKESCDTTLRVKDKEYKVHRIILSARSAVFAAMFQHDTAEKQTGIVTISDCEPESFQQFLEYLYCGRLEGVSFHTAFHLYNTSDKYDVQTLKAFCVEHFMRCITAENICDIVILADKYDETKLFAAAQDFFNRNLNQILETSEWECLLKDNYHLAKKLLKEMSMKMKVSD